MREILETSRIVLVVESRDIYDQSTKEALLMTTNVISSFLLFLVPLTLTIIAAILNSRRQPEHFMKVLLSSEFPFFCLSLAFLFNVFPAGVHPENEFSFWSSSLPRCHLFLPLHLCILSQQVQIQIQIQRVLEIQSLSYDYDMSTNTWSCPDNFVDSGGTTDDGYKVERKYQNVQPNENFCSPGVAH